jgi:hypothetical protein
VKSTIKNGTIPVTATAADCGRLWRTLTNEFIPALRLEMRIVQEDPDSSCITIEVVDDSLESLDGHPLVNIWACREFRNGLYLISVGQLFELLIAAYRALDLYFENGTPSAPARRRK